MYRFLLRSVYTARNCSDGVFESFVSPAKCDRLALSVLRVTRGCGEKALSTSSVSLCENKDSVVSSNHSEKTSADKVTDPTKAGASVTQEAEDGSKVSKMAEQSEADDGSTMQQQREVKTEHTEVKTDASKTGKQRLLNLLGTMKVDVTNKRNLKNLKVKQKNDSAPKPKPAAMESTISMFQKATEEASSQSEMLNPELVAAASAAASTLPNSSQAESELLRQLKQQEAVTKSQRKGDMNNLGVIIADMKVSKNPSRQNPWSDNPIRFDEDGRGYTHDGGITAELDNVRRRRNSFTGKRLNIFSPSTDEDGAESAAVSARPTLWDMDFANQLSLSMNQMPCNGFEEMIQWTKEGKMWQYPVNNEAGLEEEVGVPFYEHVFLEKHLEEGFPRQGPVRHFMELVVVGLSRNPYLTVQQKRDHISWFRDYFHQKEGVIKAADVS